MLGHFKKSASTLTDQETQMGSNDQWPVTICNTEMMSFFVKIRAGVLDLHGLMSVSGPSQVAQNKSLGSRPQVKGFFLKIRKFYWIELIILDKIRSFLWKLELGLWTYGWICLLDLSGPNVVSRPQAPRSIHFF